MAEKVGVKTGQITKAGRPVYKTPDGELVSEKSVTIPMGSKFINIPSIHDGVMYSEDELIDMLKNNKIEATSVHDSMEEAIEAAKSRSPNLLSQGGSMESQMDMFEEGGLKDEGGSVDPVSGNEVPSGSTKSEVRDDIPAQLSEGEFVLPADVVRYIGLENIMKMRDMAKEGLAKMEAMGQMGNSEEATMDDEADFDAEIDAFIDELDSPQEFNVGGLAGQDQTTPPSPVGFLPPGVTAPGVGTDLPQAPVITPGGPGQVPGMPSYETKQYIGPNGEIRTFTFINGQPVTPIPEGFTLYDPSKVPETKTGVPTAQVSVEGGEGPEQQTTPTVDPVVGTARAISNLNPKSSVADAVNKYDSRMMKVGAGMVASALAGSLPGLAYGAYKMYKANEDLKNTVGTTLVENNPTLSAVLSQTDDITGMSESDVSDSIETGVNMGMSPGLAAAITASGGKISTAPAVTEVDIDTGEEVTTAGKTSISGLTGSAEAAVQNTYGNTLAKANPEAYRDMIEEAAFYDATGYGIMSDVERTGKPAKQTGITTGQLVSTPVGGKFYDDYNAFAKATGVGERPTVRGTQTGGVRPLTPSQIAEQTDPVTGYSRAAAEALQQADPGVQAAFEAEMRAQEERQRQRDAARDAGEGGGDSGGLGAGESPTGDDVAGTPFSKGGLAEQTTRALKSSRKKKK